MSLRLTLAAAALALPAAAPAQTTAYAAATAALVDATGADAGTVTLTGTASGQTIVHVVLKGLPPGVHAIHIHETGACDAPDFESAGGHLAGQAEHGVLSPNGPHPGDLPNVTVAADGTADVTYFNAILAIATQVLDTDGSAFIVHSGEDDYTSQPSGDAGNRIVCGVFTADE